ncbi:unnamed protein product, partial [Phaeothamnion confervicola]
CAREVLLSELGTVAHVPVVDSVACVFAHSLQWTRRRPGASGGGGTAHGRSAETADGPDGAGTTAPSSDGGVSPPDGGDEEYREGAFPERWDTLAPSTNVDDDDNFAFSNPPASEWPDDSNADVAATSTVAAAARETAEAAPALEAAQQAEATAALEMARLEAVEAGEEAVAYVAR